MEPNISYETVKDVAARYKYKEQTIRAWMTDKRRKIPKEAIVHPGNGKSVRLIRELVDQALAGL